MKSITMLVLMAALAAGLSSCGGGGMKGGSTENPNAPPSPQTVSIAISPPSAFVNQSASYFFNVAVTGSSNHNVIWSVQEGISGGSVNAGDYQAPLSAGTYHVVATSVADNSKQAIATVTVPSVSMGALVPSVDILGPLGVRTFNAPVYGTANIAVAWTVTEGPAGGSVDANGTYVAPSTQGIYHVQATSLADPSLTSSAAITVVGSGFIATGPMQYPRAGHAAVLLPSSGNVLVTGGREEICGDECDYFSLPYSELYATANMSFQPSDTMTQSREYQSATLLNDGRVLITGGFFESDTSFSALSSAEIFASGTFTQSADLGVARAAHTATLLPDGKVLLAGGAGQATGALNTTELWDPSTGLFTSAGLMADERTRHTATFLPSIGKVLIVGGYDSSYNPLKSAELYDPSTASFSPTGDLGTAREEHTATLLPDGRVLITGGRSSVASLQTTEIYDPATGTFSPSANMVKDRSTHTATLLPSGKVLLVGGFGSSGELFTAELFDPAANSSVLTGGMTSPRADHTATLLLNGDVLVTGGYNSFGPIPFAEIYH
jgi:WD40 repeat protein